MDTSPTVPLAWSQPISQVDVHAATLRDQPNMHGIGVVTGSDGHPRMFCIDPAEADSSGTEPSSRLLLNLQTGADTVRYK